MKKPTKAPDQCEDFFLCVVEGHVLTAAMVLFEMPELDSRPNNHDYFPLLSEKKTPIERKQLFLLATNALVEKYVDLSIGKQETCAQPQSKEKSKKRSKRKSKKRTKTTRKCDNRDYVLQYASEVITLGLFLMEFVDSVREGDGERICRCWSFLLVIFKATGRKNYAIEAFKLLAQLNFVFSPRMAAQLKWSRTVNVHGLPGRNIAMDLHMEHLNRILKGCISCQGSNKSIQRVGKTIRELCEIAHSFDTENGISTGSGKHRRKSNTADLKKIINALSGAEVFSEKPRRKHAHFPKYTPVLQKVSHDTLIDWMNTQAQNLL